MKDHYKIFILMISSSLAVANSCDQEATPIHTIQGQLAQSKWMNEDVWVKGVVTAVFPGKMSLNGYFIQGIEGDLDNKTSEGLFIHDNDQDRKVKPGDLVAVKGQVSEKFKVTHVTAIKQFKVCDSDLPLPAAVPIKLPLEGYDLEQLEGMRVTLAEPYVITDLFQYIKYGELTVSSQLLMNPTSVSIPGPKIKKLQQKNKTDQLIIDDGRLDEYALPLAQGANSKHSVSANNPLLLGQKIQTTGVMHFAYGKYKIQPTESLRVSTQNLADQLKLTSQEANELSVGTFNIENFFTTIDQGQEVCGPLKNFGCRGADSKEEYERQLHKLVKAINQADATVLGLQELENNASSSISSLVNALNDDAGTEKWSFINTGLLGEDVIKVGIIYQINQVKPLGTFALLNKDADKEFLENKNRVIVAQTFIDMKGHSFNVATVHFKSKSCRDAEGLYLDQKDGQGCYNPTRIEVAEQVARWFSNDPTGQGAKASFLVGDFNSYQREDPMLMLKSKGFVNLADTFLNERNWTTSYRGTVGSLDYVLANDSATKISKGLTQWHINSIAIKDFGYDTEPLAEGLDKPNQFYRNDPFSSSDHDLVLVRFAF